MNQRIEKHQDDYIPAVFLNYSFAELGNWVHNLTKRATHRATPEKKRKDMYDAKNYLAIMGMKLKDFCGRTDININYDEL